MSATFDEQSAHRIARTVKRIEGEPVDQRSPRHHRNVNADIAAVFKITAVGSSGSYTGVRQRWTGGATFTNAGDGTGVALQNLTEGSGESGALEVNDLIVARLTYANDGSAVYVFHTGSGGGNSIVRVKITGSRDGTSKLYPAELTHDGGATGEDEPWWMDEEAVSAIFPPDVAEDTPRLDLNGVYAAVARTVDGGVVYEVLGAAVPKGTTLYQVFQIVESGNWGWDYPRFP